MTWLLDLVDDHRAAVRYDLLRHGYRLEWLGTRRLPWVDALALIDQQPPRDSAVARALHPDTYDRTRSVQTLEVLAVLLRQGNVARGNPAEARQSDFPSTFEELFKSSTSEVDEQSVLDQIAALDAFLEGGNAG